VELSLFEREIPWLPRGVDMFLCPMPSAEYPRVVAVRPCRVQSTSVFAWGKSSENAGFRAIQRLGTPKTKTDQSEAVIQSI